MHTNIWKLAYYGKFEKVPYAVGYIACHSIKQIQSYINLTKHIAVNQEFPPTHYTPIPEYVGLAEVSQYLDALEIEHLNDGGIVVMPSSFTCT